MLDVYSYFVLNSSQQQSTRRVATFSTFTDVNFAFVPNLFGVVSSQNLNANTSVMISTGSLIWSQNLNLGISGNLSSPTPNPGPSAPIGSQAVICASYGFASNWTGTWQTARVFVPRISAAAGASGTVVNWEPFFVEPQSNLLNSVNITNWRPFRCGAGSGGTTNSATGACFSTTERTGATNNAAYHIDSNSATCGAGLVAGTAFDTCWYRDRAGAWTGPAGTDIYTNSGFICGGPTCSAVTSTAQGVFDSGVRVMSSVSCTGATCSLTNGALSVTVTGTTSATVSASITGGGSCGGSVSVLGSWSNMRVTLITGTGPGCSVPGDDVFQVVRGADCPSSGAPVCNISPGDDVSPPLTWSPSGSGTTRIARTPSYGSTLSVSTTYYYDIRCGCTTD